MAENCPGFLLLEELRILQPKYVLTFGDSAWRAVTEHLPDYSERGWRDGLTWGILRGAVTAEVVSLHHPASHRWVSGHENLLASLRGEKAGLS